MLKTRDLKGLDLVIFDAHKRLVKTVQKYFPGVQWQRCQALFMCNILEKTPKNDKEKVEKNVNVILTSNINIADMMLKAMKENYYHHLLEKALHILRRYTGSFKLSILLA